MIIDCQTGDLRAAADFWSQALGMEQIEKPTDEPAPDKYIHLKNNDGHMDIEVQKVPHPSRVHLDIETDDVPAEVARLEGLAPGSSSGSRPGWCWKPRPASASAWSATAAQFRRARERLEISAKETGRRSDAAAGLLG